MKRIAATLGILVALAFPAGVLADTTGGGADVPPPGNTGGMTIQVRSIHLTTRAVAQVELALTCQPKPVSAYPLLTYWEDVFLQVEVRQASGRSIASGSVGYGFDGDALCDGTSHVVVIGVAADPSSVPFKTGSAAVGAFGSAAYSFENWETGEFGYHLAASSTGWVAARLGK
jgi:hypothetical protein